MTHFLLARFRLAAAVASQLAAGIACNSSSANRAGVSPPNGDLATQTVASGFDTIWQLSWGPDNVIWTTERAGRISRVNPQSGVATTVGQVPSVQEIGEGGLMGLAFHPDFAAQPFVYVAHTYASPSGTRNRVVRMRYDGQRLAAPEVLIADIPGSSIHNGSRVIVGPDRLLYISTGDASNASTAQDRGSPAGKILRLTLDGALAPGNPFGTAVFSYGHRNPQGLVFSPSGTLYATEHGPGDNDEVNRIEVGRNFGWPDVRGRCDGDAGSGEIAFCQTNSVVEPLVAWTPTIAPSGLAYYNSSLIPGWRGSLLFTTLKDATLYRLTLSSDGRSVTAQERLLSGRFGRLRDVLVAPNGEVYLATSNKDGRGTPLPTDDRIIRLAPQ